MEDEFSVMRTLEEMNKKEYKKARNRIYRAGEKFGNLTVNRTAFAYGGEGVTLVRYIFLDGDTKFISYPNDDKLGRSFEIKRS